MLKMRLMATILIKPHRFDVNNFAPLQGKIAKDLPVPDFDSIRHASLDKDLRS
ncbi:MAG: hypothetical protein ACJAT5_001007 [Lentimonas sp.]|jgi:hypothetical protein